MTAEDEPAQIVIADERDYEPHLLVDGIAVVFRFRRFAETAQIDEQHAVALRKLRHEVTPRERARPETVDEKERRAAAVFFEVKLNGVLHAAASVTSGPYQGEPR